MPGARANPAYLDKHRMELVRGNLKTPIRVFMVYGTALALEDGRMLFFDDIYGHDQRLAAALDARRPRVTPALPEAKPSSLSE